MQMIPAEMRYGDLQMRKIIQDAVDRSPVTDQVGLDPTGKFLTFTAAGAGGFIIFNYGREIGWTAMPADACLKFATRLVNECQKQIKALKKSKK